jgi:hypothetical protein
MTFTTVESIFNRVAVEVGLPRQTDPFVAAPLDPNADQLLTLLTSCGQELTTVFDWSQLRREHTFPTVASQEAYDLPAGFGRMVNQTGWSRTTRFPYDALSAQQWQGMKAWGLGIAPIFLSFRLAAGKFNIAPAPLTIETLAFEYESSYWVAAAGAATTSKEEPTAKTDVVWFDPLLITRLLKLRFLQAKAMDSTAAQIEYERTLDNLIGRDRAAPIISISGPPKEPKMLDEDNLPETGFGA